MLFVRHETIYRYTEPNRYTIQVLRLMPRIEAHQHTLSWTISAPGNRVPFVDAFGNQSEMLTITKPHHEINILVEGTIDVAALNRGRIIDHAGEHGGLSPLVFTVPTKLTQPDAAIADFVHRILPTYPRSHHFLVLAEAICDVVAYQTGATQVTSTAAQALQLGQGVCQDHAHLFLSCCHVMNIPARYVSGYIDTGKSREAESHAWVDVWVEEQDFSGWVSIDITHANFQGNNLCRLAVGRDYESASPVRGVRIGAGVESLAVNVKVSQQIGSQVQ